MQTPPAVADGAPDRRPDAAAPAPDAASSPDAVPAIPSRWYEYDDGPETWTSIPAADLFAGPGAPLPSDVGAVWSHCYSGIDTLCFSTAGGWSCTDDGGASFFGNEWASIHADIAANPPTHIARFGDGFSGSDSREVMFSADEKWWLYRYDERPIDFFGGLWPLEAIADHSTVGGYDELWSGDPDAPSSPDLIVASFTGFELNRRWHLWDAAGTDYSYRRGADEFENPEMSKLLELPDAPPPALVLGATRCQDLLYVLTRASN